jgi:hypothetical protein
VYKNSHRWLDALIFISFYLKECFWPDAISRWMRKRNGNKFCANLGESEWRPWQRLDKRSGKETIETEKGKRSEKSRACSLLSLTSRGLLTNNSTCQAKQSIAHTAVTFYGDCVKMREDFVPKFGDKRTGCCLKLSQTSFFTREFFTKYNMTVVPHAPYFSVFPQLKTKLKGCHFDTIELIEAESQALLNTITEHDF